jgi:aminoglycoside phosphotransferase family enzyme/predicted kinase
VEVVETHISWLFLTGEFAYKVKKPVHLGFVDFSDLAKRKFYCQEELRLNRRFTPELYLDVVPITGDSQSPMVGGAGEPIEYAVRMRQFAESARLDRVLAAGLMTPAHCDWLAETIFRGHQIAEVAPLESEFGQPPCVHRQVLDTLSIAQRELPAQDEALVSELHNWCEAEFARLEPRFAARRADGCVRECHGDLHLENMVLLGDQVRLFDCLEFNPVLRWIDVMSDVAFATMDLADRGKPDFAHRLLNRYLELSGDYSGLAILRYYQVYRAIVRAAVAGIRMHQEQSADGSRLQREAADYLELARRFTRPPKPLVVITHGFSGSGKSTATETLVESLGMIRLRSDVERQRLQRRDELSAATRYDPDSRRRVYEQMARLAAIVVDAGYPVIADATFLRADDRALFRDLAARRRLPLVVLRFEVSDEVLRRRIGARQAEGRDPSEATAEVLQLQQRELEPLTKEELACSITIDGIRPLNAADAAKQLQKEWHRATEP